MPIPARMRLLVALALLAAALTFACKGGGGGSETTQPPGGTATATVSATPQVPPEDALARFVQNRLNQGFVPHCDDAQRPDDVGKQCASKLGERDGLVAYALGPTFSDYTRILILKPEGGDWTLVTLEVRDLNQSGVPGIPWPLETGAHVVVAGTAPDCLKVRDAPGLAATQVDCLDDGTEVTVVAGPSEQDNIEWWQLQDHGWAASDYLRYPEEVATPTPES